MHATVRLSGAARGLPDQDAVVAEKRRQARPEGADAAADKRRWLEEKAKRQQEELARTGLDEGKVWAAHALLGTCSPHKCMGRPAPFAPMQAPQIEFAGVHVQGVVCQNGRAGASACQGAFNVRARHCWQA
jgi:hypothetical protein